MTVLCYHAVDPSWDSPMSVSPDAFERHAAWLARRRVVPLDDAVRRYGDSWTLPLRTAALTFDDGYESVYEHAFPVLRRLRLPATVFLVAGTLSDGRAVDWVRRPPARPLTTLSREQALEMLEGGVSFGSHSLHHRDLTSLAEDECERDLRESREILEDALGRPIRFLAYPAGRHDERVRRAAARAGYSHGFTLPEERERPGPMAIPRVGVHAGNGIATLRVKSSPQYLRARTSVPARWMRRIMGRGG